MTNKKTKNKAALKVLCPIGLATLAAGSIGLAMVAAGCSCKSKGLDADVTITIDGKAAQLAEGSSVKKGERSTFIFDIGSKAIKQSTLSIKIGGNAITEGFTVQDNKIIIEADKMTDNNIQISFETEEIITGFSVTAQMPTKVNHTLSPSDIEAKVTYKSGTTKTLDYSKNEYKVYKKLVTEPDTSYQLIDIAAGYKFETAGDFSIKITYAADETFFPRSFPATIVDAKSMTAEIISGKENKKAGDRIKPADLNVNVKYSDDVTEGGIWNDDYIVFYDGTEVTDFGTNGIICKDAGELKITVKSKSKPTIEHELTFTVSETEVDCLTYSYVDTTKPEDGVKVQWNKQQGSISEYATIKIPETHEPSANAEPTVTQIAQDGFNGWDNTKQQATECANIRKVVLPKTIKKLNSQAFNACSNLKSINLEDCTNLTDIEFCALQWCTSLEQVKIPGTVHSIGNGAFSHDASLKLVDWTELTDAGSVWWVGNTILDECPAFKEGGDGKILVASTKIKNDLIADSKCQGHLKPYADFIKVAEVEKIEIDASSTHKTNFLTDDYFDTTGLKLKVTYKNGIGTRILDAGFTTDFDNRKKDEEEGQNKYFGYTDLGIDKEVTISFEGQTCKYKINVTERTTFEADTYDSVAAVGCMTSEEWGHYAVKNTAYTFNLPVSKVTTWDPTGAQRIMLCSGEGCGDPAAMPSGYKIYHVVDGAETDVTSNWQEGEGPSYVSTTPYTTGSIKITFTTTEAWEGQGCVIGLVQFKQ